MGTKQSSKEMVEDKNNKEIIPPGAAQTAERRDPLSSAFLSRFGPPIQILDPVEEVKGDEERR